MPVPKDSAPHSHQCHPSRGGFFSDGDPPGSHEGSSLRGRTALILEQLWQASAQQTGSVMESAEVGREATVEDASVRHPSDHQRGHLAACTFCRPAVPAPEVHLAPARGRRC